MKKICFTVLLLFAFTAPGYAEICGVGYYVTSSGVCEPCPGHTYNDVPDATECKPCPEDNTQYQDSCDVDYGQFACDVFVNNGLTSLEQCQDLTLSRYFYDEKGNYYVVTYFDTNGQIIGFRAMGECNEGYVLVRIPATEDEFENGMWFETMDEALNVCADFSGGLPDGYIYMYGIVVPCDELHPILIHSDGARTEISDCYGYSNSGYYVTIDTNTGELLEEQCVPGDYCPGGIKVRVDVETMTVSGGNMACNALPGDHDVSPENATSAPGAINPTDCYVDVGGGESGTFKDEYGTYISGGGMCHYTID
ncbi:MAG: hypothetical protein E7009_01925 [Alphaproteobacteria bacterium]|nr:hypothetical protein [Alphaproteobacteria bacterium]